MEEGGFVTEVSCRASHSKFSLPIRRIAISSSTKPKKLAELLLTAAFHQNKKDILTDVLAEGGLPLRRNILPRPSQLPKKDTRSKSTPYSSPQERLLRGFRIHPLFYKTKNRRPKGLRFFVVEEGGFEPPKRDATDLQSAPFGHSGTPPYGAGERTRTPDLLITNQLLYQLSYTSV